MYKQDHLENISKDIQGRCKIVFLINNSSEPIIRPLRIRNFKSITLVKKRMPLVEKISIIADNKIPYKTVKELTKSLKKGAK